MSNRKRGVYDPGAVAGGVTEADIVLQWALTLKWVLSANGIDSFLTRSDDREDSPVSLVDDKAESAGCDFLVSLHCNGSESPIVNGTETFFRDAADKSFAEIVHRSAMSAMKSNDRKIKPESQSQHNRLAVFEFDGPCCLLEIGFISNDQDRAKMLSRDIRLAFAKAFAKELLS